MSEASFHEQAETCRQRALAYLGRPEASFLLRAAREFDRLERRQNLRWNAEAALESMKRHAEAFDVPDGRRSAGGDVGARLKQQGKPPRPQVTG